MSSLLPCFLALHISRLAMQKSDTVASSREHCPAAAASDFFVLLLEFQNASNILMLHKNATDAAATYFALTPGFRLKGSRAYYCISDFSN